MTKVGQTKREKTVKHPDQSVLKEVTSPQQVNVFMKQEKNKLVAISTHLKNISQIGLFPQVRGEVKNIWNQTQGRLRKPCGIQKSHNNQTRTPPCLNHGKKKHHDRRKNKVLSSDWK